MLKKLTVLMSSSRTDVHGLLQDLATILLSRQNRTLKSRYLADLLSEESRHFLRARKIGLKAVLLCHMQDFRCAGAGRQFTTTYLHSELKTEWSIASKFTVSL
eukprot:TRINITY_DN48741_c0_g1_i1.p1 TRINITY_DN48741_c0_g1~~TRINITY_DN48741_c0_g1_i1.p1  ORF type:complete len:103 (+),score=12.43 TRINITY_DN48741_c0_g1_i1:126-434(+)